MELKDLEIRIKQEPYPIGEVLSVISSWQDTKLSKIYGEFYLVRKSEQSKITAERIIFNNSNIDAKNVKIPSIANILYQKTDYFHVYNNLIPESKKIPTNQYNPYFPERNNWIQIPEGNLFYIIAFYKEIFEFIQKNTKNPKLKEKIDFAFREKKSFSIENIGNDEN